MLRSDTQTEQQVGVIAYLGGAGIFFCFQRRSLAGPASLPSAPRNSGRSNRLNHGWPRWRACGGGWNGRKRGAGLVVFPELALTTFFPRHYHGDISRADLWFETSVRSEETAPLFDAARRHGIGFHLSCAESVHEADEAGVVPKRRLNTSILGGPEGDVC